MKKAKIVHLTSVHSALDNRIYHRECVSLADAGFPVTIIGPHPTDVVTNHVCIKGIPAERGRIARATRAAWRVYAEALRQNGDIYHFHDPELIPVGLMLRAHGKKVVYDIHEDLPRDILFKHYLPVWSRRTISWIAERIEIATCGCFSALVPVTPFIAERFRSLHKRVAVVLNYPRTTDFMTTNGSLTWESRGQSVAYVGGVTTNRGIREMVVAMSLLPQKLCATLEIAGNEVPDHDNPQEITSHPGWQRVRHRGTLDPPAVVRLLCQVRAGLVVIHPTLGFLESMPLKMFEYMAAGIPVIASDFPLWHRVLDKIGCAILVDPLNPEAIAAAIEYLLTHPGEAEDMGRRGQAAIREQYNWETQEKTLFELYAGLLEPACVE
jgi:hypothetical protein